MKRLGSLLERYGTYEMNGIAFQDVDEIWWLETIGDIIGSREKFLMM
ncbi:MAG: C69 family dipeptidase [Coprococcus sp.]